MWPDPGRHLSARRRSPPGKSSDLERAGRGPGTAPGDRTRTHRAGGAHRDAPGRAELQRRSRAPAGESGASASGPEDYCLALGVEPSADGAELHYALSRVVTVCKAVGIAPMGLLGSIAGFRDLGAFERAASRARDLGCVGASCIHPDQVAILNRVFYAAAGESRVRTDERPEAFEAGLRNGTASVSVDGAMVDTPVYRRAKHILEQAAAIAEVENRKAAALARLT
ncbi:MAG: aldolase/citrate lyase family protein [Rhodopseudomonas palustris]|nr:aldolase/citrate lyase family protein [Rhodopseudomonas palustris]